MKTRKNTNTTTTTPATAESGKTYFDTVLDKVKYVGDGNAPDGSAFTIEDSEVGLGLTALEWLCYEVAKKFVVSRDYLPTHMQDAVRRISRVKLGSDKNPVFTPFITSGDAAVDDLREAVKETLLTSLREGNRKNAIGNALKALDAEIVHDKYEAREYKTLPKEEVLCPVDIGLIQSLIVGETSYEVSYPSDESSPEIVVRYEVSPALTAIFDGVKKAHPFAFTDSKCKRWQAFEYFVLNITGKEIASRLTISEQRVSALNRETCSWLLDDVKKLDFEALSTATNSRETIEALRWIALAAA